MSNSLEPGQARHFGPKLVAKGLGECADMQRVKPAFLFMIVV